MGSLTAMPARDCVYIVGTDQTASLCRSSGLDVAAVLSDVPALEMSIPDEMPDVIVLDTDRTSSPSSDVARIKDLLPMTPILLLVRDEDPQMISEAMTAGAAGYVTRRAAAEQLPGAVQVVTAGGSYLDPLRARLMVDQLGSPERTSADASSILTSREKEVLTHLSEGKSARQISKVLGLSERTVNTHVANLYRKLGSTNRVEAIREGMRLGLIAGPK